MKIGIVTTWFERGAAYVSKIYKDQLEKQGHTVVIYARGGEKYAIGDPLWDLEEVTWGKRVSFPVESYVDNNCFANWLDKSQPDVVIFNEQRWFPPILQCRERGIKVGAYIDFYTEEMLPTFKIYDFLICNTHKHKEAFDWHCQCYYVPWGTDINLFKPVEKDLNKEITYFHSAGMNPFRKGTDLLLLAFKKLVASGVDNVKLVIHTQVSSLEDFFKNSRQSQNKEELYNAIKYLTERKMLALIYRTVTAPGLYHLGDVYVYPSRLDGLGLTVTEALACGLPTIVPDDGPMNEFINESNGKICLIERFYARSDGYYWPQNIASIDSLSDRMKDYALMSKLEINERKKKTRIFAECHLDADRNFSKLTSILETSKRTVLAKKDLEYINSFYPKKYQILSKLSFIYKLYKK
ncbi:glycosyltransferase family 4 protein [Vibrio navarrensis]|uniref:glycosyltransferase family 4 protein n=1 Tax=Vibrio navarrensis TaxID=29495 RepID=UPI0018DDD253|nr:glycosyltransferase family 4 protein [Vibrio navarrensis]MBH9739861.1 glycosyl transferase family 1 [Vibrio navarrensis]